MFLTLNQEIMIYKPVIITYLAIIICIRPRSHSYPKFILHARETHLLDCVMHASLKTALFTLSWVPVFISVQQVCGQLIWIQGRSMQPSLNPDSSLGTRDLLLIQKYGLRRADSFSKGDVVILHSPIDPEKILVKRITALQNETVKPRSSSYPKKQLKIPPNHLWIEGDSIHSVDSNSFGPVSSGLVVGKARWIVYPFNRYGPIPSKSLDME